MQRNTGKPQIRSQCILKYKGMATARARSCPRGLQSLLEGCPMATRIVRKRSPTCSRIPFHYATTHKRATSCTTHTTAMTLNHIDWCQPICGVFTWVRTANVYVLVRVALQLCVGPEEKPPLAPHPHAPAQEQMATTNATTKGGK